MSSRPTYLMLLWHMHQPFYKDLAEGTYSMPWVRLHALKDYYGMVAMLKEFPEFHATFNLVPSLVSQLQEYARDEVREQAFDLAFKPADQLTPTDRENLVEFSFQLNLKNQVNRFPRLRELYDKFHTATSRDAARFWAARDFLDLQVLSQLAWFDEIYLESDVAVGSLVRKGRGYTEDDKLLVRKKEIEIFNVTLEEYRSASERGQIELSTSPFYHPILPLLCDSNIAEESHPGVRLPHRAYRHPDDAVEQLKAAVGLHEEVFGRRPRGLWPSEGSVSDEVLRLAAREGFAWTATDEGVLGRSLPATFSRHSDGTLEGARELYRPYRFSSDSQQISIFFRDHYLSDLIGFAYANMPAQAAAHHLHQRIHAAARWAGDGPRVISIILDGENAWEYFPGNGREFLKCFYKKVVEDPDLKAVTASEALELCEHGSLSHVVPGSWINANFDVWIGAEEDNRAWDLLAEARDFFEQNQERTSLNHLNRERARHEVWISEGSDWCWWYGPEHSSGHDEEFDRLYRTHLSNIYRLLGKSPPDNLAVSIKGLGLRAVNYPPTGAIEPLIDGLETSYFEWLGAGIYLPDTTSGSMHGVRKCLEALYYGCGRDAVFLRLDFPEHFRKEHPSCQIRISIDGDTNARLHASIRENKVAKVEFWKANEELKVPFATTESLQANYSQIFEARLAFGALGISAGSKIQLQISLWADDLPLQIMPQEGWLILDLSEEFQGW
ncbi:MAG: glycoside hydrolase family 57 protein [Terriglobia bacterium]